MFLRHNYLGISWALLILMLCGLPGGQFENAKYPHADKVIHLLLFAVLYVLLTVGFIKQTRFKFLRKRTLNKTFVFSLGYGVLIEFLQGVLFVDRSVEMSDIVFNLFGCCIGVGVFLYVYGLEEYT